MRFPFLLIALPPILLASLFVTTAFPAIDPTTYTLKSPGNKATVRVQIAAAAAGRQNVSIVGGNIEGSPIKTTTITLDNGLQQPCAIPDNQNSLVSCNFIVECVHTDGTVVFKAKISLVATKALLENNTSGDLAGGFIQLSASPRVGALLD